MDQESTSKPHGSLSTRYPATDQDIVTEMSRLSIHYPGSLTAQESAIRLASFVEDLRGKTIEEIRNACRRYRQNVANKFYPTPGQILDLMKNPYDAPRGKSYGPIRHDDGPQVTIERAREIMIKYGFKPSETMAEMTETVLGRAAK